MIGNLGLDQRCGFSGLNQTLFLSGLVQEFAIGQQSQLHAGYSRKAPLGSFICVQSVSHSSVD